jgi:hypothetical protein
VSKDRGGEVGKESSTKLRNATNAGVYVEAASLSVVRRQIEKCLGSLGSATEAEYQHIRFIQRNVSRVAFSANAGKSLLVKQTSSYGIYE